MNIFSAVFSTCFMILGCLVWIVALLIILTGALGVLRVTFNEVFKVDVIDWVSKIKKKEE